MSQLMRISILGALPSGEEWTVNPVYRLGTGLDVPVSQENMQAIVTAINARAVPTAVTQLWSTTTTVTGVRAEARMADGTLQSLAEGSKATPTIGAGTGTHPFQTAIVSSLRSSATGARGRGRLYWPATGIALTTGTLRVSAAAVSSYLSGVKTYLSGIETDIEASVGGASLAVWSRVGSTLSAVHTIQMGDVCDVQRRRRDQLVEAYTSTSYP